MVKQHVDVFCLLVFSCSLGGYLTVLVLLSLFSLIKFLLITAPKMNDLFFSLGSDCFLHDEPAYYFLNT